MLKVAVLGAGTMGHGIAQIAGMAGHAVSLYDVSQEALDRGVANIRLSLDRFTASGQVTDADAALTLTRITPDLDLDSCVRDVEVVIESVPEDLAIKAEVLRRLSKTARPRILASNTSQMLVSELAEHAGELADRFIGMHFFNPPVRMRLVEIVRGLTTSDQTVDGAVDFAISLGKEVVVCQKDSPGFITTRAYAALRMECLRIIQEGVATAEDVDLAVRLAFNFPMGPLELADFNGLDTVAHSMESLAKRLGDRFSPGPILLGLVEAGHLGRKTGRGFFTYTDHEDSAGSSSAGPPVPRTGPPAR